MRSPLSRIPVAPGLASLVLRAVVGVVLVAHGLPKLERGVGAFAANVADLGVPFPEAAAWGVVAIEVVGGAMLLAGLLTRIWAVLAAALMAGTTLLAKVDAGLVGSGGQSGMELDLLILAGALAIALIGPGPASVDHVAGIDRSTTARAVRPAATTAARAPASRTPLRRDEPRVTIALDDERVETWGEGSRGA